MQPAMVAFDFLSTFMKANIGFGENYRSFSEKYQSPVKKYRDTVGKYSDFF